MKVRVLFHECDTQDSYYCELMSSDWCVSDSVQECRGISKQTYFIVILMHESTQADLRSSQFSLQQPAYEFIL